MSNALMVSLESNQRHGHGFQLHTVHGPMDWVYDEEPLTMYEAGAYVKTLVDTINEKFGTSYEPHQVMRVSTEALEANARTDFAAARFLQDIKSGSYDLSTPAGNDFEKAVIDGEEQFLLSGRGVIVYSYFTWAKEKNQKAKELLGKYCEYISLHGHRGGAQKALEHLVALDQDRALEWIRKTHARHVKDDAALIEYVMGPVKVQKK